MEVASARNPHPQPRKVQQTRPLIDRELELGLRLRHSKQHARKREETATSTNLNSHKNNKCLSGIATSLPATYAHADRLLRLHQLKHKHLQKHSN